MSQCRHTPHPPPPPKKMHILNRKKVLLTFCVFSSLCDQCFFLVFFFSFLFLFFFLFFSFLYFQNAGSQFCFRFVLIVWNCFPFQVLHPHQRGHQLPCQQHGRSGDHGTETERGGSAGQGTGQTGQSRSLRNASWNRVYVSPSC